MSSVESYKGEKKVREQIKKHPIYKGNRNKSLCSRQGDHFMHCVRGGA